MPVKKVLSINTSFSELGGAEKLSLEEISILKENGFEVKTFSLDVDNAKTRADYIIKDDKILDKEYVKNKSLFFKIRIFLKILFNYQVYKTLKEAISAFNPDVIHMHRVKVFSPSLYLVLKKYTKKKIMTLHDHYLTCPSSSRLLGNGLQCPLNKCKYLYAIKNKCVRNSAFETLISLCEFFLRRHIIGDLKVVTQYIVPSKFMMKWTVESGIPKEKVVFLPNFTSFKVNYSETYIQEGIAYIGRFTEQKGLSILLEAAKKTPEINYYLIGKGPYERQILQFISRYNCKNIFIKGALYGEELIVFIRHVCALVLPSVWPENAPLTILEAYSQGIPVIGSDKGGIPEFIVDGKTGLIFQSGDINKLAEQTRLIVKSTKEFRKNCIEQYMKYFTKSIHFQKLCEIYE